MRLEHHLVGGYVRYISPHIITIIITKLLNYDVEVGAGTIISREMIPSDMLKMFLFEYACTHPCFSVLFSNHEGKS